MATGNIGTANSGEMSAAQKLMQKHTEPHAATVEDVPDEEDPTQASSSASGSRKTPITTVSTDKQKETGTSKTSLDTQSRELFPELGAGKGKGVNTFATSTTPIWSAKGKSNGNPSNGGPQPLAPSSGNGLPVKTSAPAMSIPGRNVETVTLEPQFVLERGQLKRPIPDILKDINRKSRANISMSTASNGRLRFDATGPPEVAQQALKDLVQQIGKRVS